MVEQPRWAVCDASPSMSLVEILRSLGQLRWAVWDASPSMGLVEIFTFVGVLLPLKRADVVVS